MGELRAEFDKHKIPVPEDTDKDLKYLTSKLDGKQSFNELATTEGVDEHGTSKNERWEVRQAIFRTNRALKAMEADKSGTYPEEMRHRIKETREGKLAPVIEFIPIWVVVCTALALGIGTCIGYKRIVITVAEKIGKTHLTYGQGAAAEAVAAVTILAADVAHLPVSTTQVLSSGVAGTMAANGSGVQGATCRKIFMAWALTLPASVCLAAVLFWVGRFIVS